MKDTYLIKEWCTDNRHSPMVEAVLDKRIKEQALLMRKLGK